ncbi:unnamed protein product [Rhizoctonia solani]|uniref:Uncharacterized protein n=1 Tax=Rhizoctonia solani TaxID=456999 RepID=A0A8H2XN10_9AGAM|nr:unnamed protein product [Rhizoctonia solani]
MNRNQPTPSIFESAILYNMNRTASQESNNHAMDNYNRCWPHNQSRLTTYQHTQMDRSVNTIETASGTQVGNNRLYTVIQALDASIPPSIDTTQIMREEHCKQIIYEYHLQRSSYWFTRPPLDILLRQPKLNIRALYLGARLFRALEGNMVSRYIDRIDKLEQELGCQLGSSPSLNSAAGWLTTQICLAYFKFVAIGSCSGYLTLQKLLPVFLCLVAADSSLHIEYSGGLVTSFPRTLGAPQYELQWFVMYDAIASLLLGTPPLAEYGYNGECDPASHSLEWAHGIPVTFIEIVSQVSSWRAGSRVPPLDDWRKLEMRVLGWRSQLKAEGKASDNLTVKLAIQEGWKYVTLIYIYMGMCGVSSHDERIQASIRQIIQLGEALENLPIGVHTLAHCVIVGLAAKYEKHRSIVHKKILSFKGYQVWLFRGSEFAQVLEYLWFGVGAGGAPVIWDDYIESRRAVVPI